jgi:hypothetical protein
MQVNFASNRKIFVFLFCVFVNNYIWFWIPVRALIKEPATKSVVGEDGMSCLANIIQAKLPDGVIWPFCFCGSVEANATRYFIQQISKITYKF